MPLNHSQRSKDKLEDQQACRDAIALLNQAREIIEKARGKLSYNKETPRIEYELGNILYDLKDAVERLEDPNLG